MSDFIAALRDDPHRAPRRMQVEVETPIVTAILDTLGFIRKSRMLTRSDVKLVA